MQSGCSDSESYLLSFETRNTLRSEGKKSSIMAGCPSRPPERAGWLAAWGGEACPGLRLDARFGDNPQNGASLPWVEGERRGELAGPETSRSYGLAPPGARQPWACPQVPCHWGRARGNLPWVLGIRWVLQCLDPPVGEEEKAVGVTSAWRAGAAAAGGGTLTCRPFCPGSPGSPMLPLAP